jgi:cyclohexadienyl dehydratase
LTRAISNPGGSNERFARANFKWAALTLHGENVTISDEILANRADVFVTESAEAITQQKLKPGLCAINPDRPLW